MKNNTYIYLNILWNITGLGLCYCMYLSIFDFMYILTKRGALDRFCFSAYFAPFDRNCHWKKRFPYCKPVKKQILKTQSEVEKDLLFTYEELDNYDILDED